MPDSRGGRQQRAGMDLSNKQFRGVKCVLFEMTLKAGIPDITGHSLVLSDRQAERGEAAKPR